ncbi:MAG: ATP phosphoribosyltransferase regulatory subunit [Oleiphilaceae bacterium]|nr:ATP phosphoribosyltransferase regulatory subunit [Oleiphilaceae bacterium]
MSDSNPWLLPDGVEDLLPPMAGRIETLRRGLIDTYQRWGYELITPPMIEYLESLLTGTGNDLDLQTFKVTDQLTGRLMGVRADMTPQAARIDAHTLRRPGVTRLCYAGHVLRARPEHLMASRAPIQTGCELFGSRDGAADQEIIHLMLATLQVAGLESVHLDLAHVSIYECLASEAKLSRRTEAKVFDALRRKSIPELDELLGDAGEGSAAQMLCRMARLGGGADALQQAREQLSGAPEAVSRALDELEQVAEAVSRLFPGVSLGFDFCELRGYNYHTGLVFAAYVPGHGNALAQGGRYDAIGQDFGRARPATGFSADLRAMAALGRAPQSSASGAIWAPPGTDAGLQQRIAELRRTETVIQGLPDDATAGAGCDRQLKWQDNDWQLVPLQG